MVQHSSHPYILLGKQQFWLYGPLLAIWYLCFLTHYLSLSEHLFQGEASFNFSAATSIPSDFGAQESHGFYFYPSICHEVMGSDVIILVFWMLSFKSVFVFSSFTLVKRLFSSSSLFVIRMASSAYLMLLIFLP